MCVFASPFFSHSLELKQNTRTKKKFRHRHLQHKRKQLETTTATKQNHVTIKKNTARKKQPTTIKVSNFVEKNNAREFGICARVSAHVRPNAIVQKESYSTVNSKFNSFLLLFLCLFSWIRFASIG